MGIKTKWFQVCLKFQILAWFLQRQQRLQKERLMNDFSSALNNFQAVQRRVSEKEKESIARARAGSRLSVSSFPREGHCKPRVSPRHFPLPTTGPVHSAPNESHQPRPGQNALSLGLHWGRFACLHFLLKTDFQSPVSSYNAVRVEGCHSLVL